MRTFHEVQLSESKMKGLGPTDWLRSCLNFILIVVHFFLYVPFGFFYPGKKSLSLHSISFSFVFFQEISFQNTALKRRLDRATYCFRTQDLEPSAPY